MTAEEIRALLNKSEDDVIKLIKKLFKENNDLKEALDFYKNFAREVNNENERLKGNI